MRRVQAQITDEQLAALQQRARDSGQPVAAVVREALDAWLAGQELDARWDRALAVVGVVHSGWGDLAERHDDHLDGPD